MLHRLNLRVLPSLNALVTAPTVRKRKRLVMLVPGLVAFGLYRLIKLFIPLSDPFVLLAFSGVLSSLTALWAYRMGRGISVWNSLLEDGWRRFAWVIGWVGFVYGVQLSLLVLALLRLFVHYNFLEHPEGPAMMAIIIACTSVTRDAFEIGYVRKTEQQGQSLLTFPDGGTFRQWIQMDTSAIGKWTISATGVGIVGSLILSFTGDLGRGELMQAIVMSVIAACLACIAFFSGESLIRNWLEGLKSAGWLESLRFWMWPCFTFAITYYLVQSAILTFLVRTEMTNGLIQMLLAGTTAGMMTGYCYYLGRQKTVETRSQQAVPENLRTCPFVMSMLNKAGVFSPDKSISSIGVAPGHSEKA